MADTRKIFGVEVPISDPLIITIDDRDNNGLLNEGDDVTKDVKQKLVDHLSNHTKAGKNSPIITNNLSEFSLTDGEGFPAPLDNTNAGAQTTFSNQLKETDEGQQAVNIFEQISKNGTLGEFEIKKGKENSQKPSILDVINDVNENQEESKLAIAVSKTQLENNGKNNENQFLAKGSNLTEEQSGVGTIKLQKNLGQFLPKKNGPTENPTLKINNLKNMGLQMLLEASGEYFVPDDSDDFSQTVLAKASATAPGLARMGIKIPVSRFSATEIAKQVNSGFEKQSSFPVLDGRATYSYGSPNNPLVPFSAASSTSSKAAAILLATTVGMLLKSLAELLGENGYDEFDSLKEQSQMGVTSRDRLGSYLGRKKDTGNSANGLFNINNLNPLSSNGKPVTIRTRHDYSIAVQKGLDVFFGEGPGGGNPIASIGGAALGAAASAVGIESNAFKNLTESHGFYNVVLRMLIRSTTDTILGAINSVAGTVDSITGGNGQTFLENAGVITPLDVNPNIGLDSDPTNILNVIDSIRNSRLLKFANILASLGDISLIMDESGVSLIDSIEDIDVDNSKLFPNPSSLVKKNRLSDKINNKFSNKLAWSSNTLRSLHLIPQKTINASAAHNNDNGNSFKDLPWDNFKEGQNGRISNEEVDRLEEELDACYMPFYFHDLRTNEIISFHAFIENITDQFQMELVESQGFGRIGKSFNYKNTNRDIACSFQIVATTKQDFYEMWHKINKLVTMVYPQYTSGRELTTADGKKFIQPFSQLISNSPLIRFRLGDLIKTNFSTLDLKKLFGSGIVENSVFKSVDGNIDVQQLFKTAKQESQLNYEFESGDSVVILNPTTNGGPVSRQAILKQKQKGQDSFLGFSSNNQMMPLNFGSKLKVIIGRKIEEKVYEISVADDYGFTLPDNIETLVADFSRQSPGSAIELINDESMATTAGEEIPVDAFFSPEANPIIKSFDSVRGEGLPGFIKTISFDWSKALWETEDLNDRAPMFCKIDISFAPIMEINPGLDSNGEMIGAPYNIGAIMSALKSKRKQSRFYNLSKIKAVNKK